MEPYFGVNMSGAEFAAVYPGVEEQHYGYPNKSDIEYFSKKGFKLIRFPFRWERVQKQLGGELDQTEINKMKAVVTAAQELGVYVILDLHNFGRYCTYSNGVNSNDNNYAVLGSRTCSTAMFCDLWKRLTKEFMDFSNIWGYDIMNEPHDMLTSTPWETIAQECIDAIRTIDTKTPIIIEGNEYASASKWTNLNLNLHELTDPSNKLIFQAHVYFDNDASGKY
ncbi:MAG: glycoside hydrolase family 5 protein, partial [Prevotella sp.]|nr:glycoside hydrolase family 5 protein [Prevotella sp.]